MRSPRDPRPRPAPRLFAAACASAVALGAHACGGSPPSPPEVSPRAALPAATRDEVRAAEPASPSPALAGTPIAADPREVHLRDLRQLTFGGENAEAYFSPDGHALIFQATLEPGGCDQQYVYELATGATRRISSGEGRTTCGFFTYPVADHVVFSSTEHLGPECPPPPDHSRGYVWSLYDYDLYRALPDGQAPEALARSPFYDAEATIRFHDGRIVFTSDREGDLELYSMAADGTDLRRLTRTPGYDGGAFFSPDGTKLVWRAFHPTGAALAEYRALLGERLVRPTRMELFVARADGSDPRQVTANGAANFGPYFLPDNRRVIFASNVGGSGREFDLYIVDPEGPADAHGDRPLERVTFAEGFDGFPMFSPDGRRLVFASNRHGSRPGETNLFLAEWVP